ncbi:MAG: DUF4258 domain-containing protein [Phycisphaerae bacterium]|nr:DUF4258 domain-containing protein [Phycisphaerae bacterium]
MIKSVHWPDWWDWELRFTKHLLQRMVQRGFGEVELRAMLHDARDLIPDREAGRWVVLARWEGKDWKVIIEPDADGKVVWVLTAFEV